jgi:hypothetical protein
MIDYQIPGYPVNECGELAVTTVFTDMPKNLQKGLLGQVPGIFFTVDHFEDKIENLLLIATDYLFEILNMSVLD